jgi:hypothetical protein
MSKYWVACLFAALFMAFAIGSGVMSDCRGHEGITVSLGLIAGFFAIAVIPAADPYRTPAEQKKGIEAYCRKCRVRVFVSYPPPAKPCVDCGELLWVWHETMRKHYEGVDE